MSIQQKQRGFTIIEVVLVLAIAALIFLMVFIALPALQRNQRDTARKTVLGKVSSAVTTYQSNKRGAQPTKGVDLQGYVDGRTGANTDKGAAGDFTGSSDDTVIDNDYIVTVKAYAAADAGRAGNADTNVVQVITGATCNATGDGAASGTTRNAAILIKLENGSALVCQAV
ncbi:MAG: type II secretion system protein [Candidatus Saccharimonas aalborgensis]|jgi:prepilin-type N-terminal cleavage/methylation domain-containing protein